MLANQLDERTISGDKPVGKTRLVFINSHPIQYFGPLYQQIARQKSDVLDLTVLYLSDETTNGYTDKQFGARVEWDIPLLDGYKHRFVKNDSWKPSIYNGFFGLLNWRLIGELRRMPKSIVICHGWAYASNVLALWAAKAFGHTVCLRGENPLSHEMARKSMKRKVRDWYLKRLIFSVTDKFLYIGRQNKLLYESFGINQCQLVFVPYAVDNERFHRQYLDLVPQRKALREQQNLDGKKVIVFCGKLIAKKRPMDLLRAYHKLSLCRNDVALLFIGEGELQAELEAYIARQQLQHVRITGFVNQTDLARYYTLGDVFVMCSGVGETWGLSVNEAMNFGLPVVVSDLTGCADDLVSVGQNGLVFKSGDVDALANCLQQVLYTHTIDGSKSMKIIDRYSYGQLINGLTSMHL
jgi:glycosyltransferase involved in cell wall biosynthesis